MTTTRPVKGRGLPAPLCPAREDGKTSKGYICTKFCGVHTPRTPFPWTESRASLPSPRMVCILCGNALASVNSLRKHFKQQNRWRTGMNGLPKVALAPSSVVYIPQDRSRWLLLKQTFRWKNSSALFAAKSIKMNEVFEFTSRNVP